VINKGGAGGDIGAAEIAKSKPDGYTIGFMNVPNTLMKSHERPTTWNLASFVPIANLVYDPAVFAVRPNGKYQTLAALVADAKKRPGEISFSSSGNYGAAHVPFEMFIQASGIKLLHVPYRGGGPALAAFIGKQVDITAQAPGPITPHVQSGAVRLLANWGAKRAAEYPDVPTMIELGYKDVEYYIWAGLFAPKATPAPVVSRLRDAMRQVMADTAVTSVFVKAASPPAYMDQPDFAKFVDADAKRLIPVIRKIGRLDEK